MAIAPEPGPDLTAATAAAEAEVPAELVAQNFGEYARAYVARVRNGQSGVLPVIVGLVAVMVVFEVISPNHVFLSAGNLVNLFEQSAVFIVLAMAETFALLLGEIDLSVGFVGACGAVIAVQLVQPATTKWPWWAAILAGLAFCAAVGAVQGTIIARLGIPSFIVTLAGFLIFNGVMLILLLLGPFSGYPNLNIQDPNVQVLFNLMAGTIDPTVSWIAMAVIVLALGAFLWFGDRRRRKSGLVAPPVGLTVLKIVLIAAAGITVVAISDINRANFGT